MKIILTEGQLRKIIHLNESIKQGEDLYRKLYNKEISKEDPNYIELKNILIKNNNVGFMPMLIKFFGDDFSNAISAYNEYIIPNINIIKKLPKQPIQYNNYSEFMDDLDNANKNAYINKIANLIPKSNVSLYSNFKESLINVISFNDVKYFLDNIYPTKFLKIFTNIINRFSNNPDGLVDYFNNVIKDHKRGFTYDKMLPKIETLGDEIKILTNKNDDNESYIFLWTKTYEALKLVGAVSWCIWGSEDNFQYYTKNRAQFVLLDFANDDINYGVIGFTINPDDNEIIYSHLRDNRNFVNGAKEYLTNKGFLKLINFGSKYVRKIEKIESEVRTLNREINDTYNVDKILYYLQNQDYTIINNYIINLIKLIFEIKYIDIDVDIKHIKNYVKKIYLIFLSNVIKKNYNDKKIKEILSLAHQKLNSVPYPVMIEKNKQKVPIMGAYNFFNQFLNEIYTDKDSLKIQSVLENMYIKGYDFDSTTKSIIQYNIAEKYGRDKAISFVKMRADKRGEEQSPLVFHGTKDKSNYKPQILDKIQQSRKDNINQLELSEVKYALENGMEKPIRDLYDRLLKTYLENQLDYNDMSIYKNLGMFDKLKNVIVKKGDVWGIDTLNSIELSIYQIAKQKT